ncbi:MAG: hypothetical protein ACT4QA_24210, partial [Panacagrimonas sp.]
PMLLPIHICDQGRALLLDYEQFMEYHDCGALAGAAIGWRAMEQAAMLLSDVEVWDRADLTVTARHDGPGVRDALEYVTRCFTRNRYQSETPQGRGGPCGSAVDFHFTVSDGRRVVAVVLREGMVPESFFAAVSRCRDEPDSMDARAVLSEQKAAVANAVVDRELRELFLTTVTDLLPRSSGGRTRA